MLGITPQGIRKYCDRNNVPRAGRTWQITESVLAQMRVYYRETNETDETKQEKATKKEKATDETANIPKQDMAEALQECVKALTAQLEAKDAQIKSLQESLNNAFEQNSRLAESLADTTKALSASKALESASKAFVQSDGQTLDLSHYSPSDAPQKPRTFLQRLKWLIKG